MAPRLTGGDPYKLADRSMVMYAQAIATAATHAGNEEVDDLTRAGEFIDQRGGPLEGGHMGGFGGLAGLIRPPATSRTSMPPEGSLVQRSFAGGEAHPGGLGPADIPNYQHGLKTARNGYIMRQGGFTNRPGTAMVATVANSMAGKVRLIPFIFGVNVSFVLEFGDKYMRVYQDGAQVQVTPGNAYQIVSPYAIADLPNLQFVQISNVLYFACSGSGGSNYPIYQLTSGGAQDWTFGK